MTLLHPITNTMTSASIELTKEGEYKYIKFSDSLKIIDESYIYDILFNSGAIQLKEYNNKFWNNSIEHIN